MSGEGAIIEGRGISVAFGGQSVLRNIDLSIQAGDIILLRGENGSGKTTLINILTGAIPPSSGTICYNISSQRRKFEFPRLASLQSFDTTSVARMGVGRVWQDVRLFESLSVSENVAISAMPRRSESPLAAIFRDKRLREVEALVSRSADNWLARLGLTALAQRDCSKLSLGQAKRVAIARALNSGAAILFLDEPLAGLDSEGILQVVELLREVSINSKISMVIVEHALNDVHLGSLANKSWTLSDGNLEVLPFSTTKMLQDWDRERALIRAFLPDNRDISEQNMPNGAKLLRAPAPGKGAGGKLLDLTGAVIERDRRVVIGSRGEGVHLDLALSVGEVAILLAPNGWGKSSLVETIAGLNPLLHGRLALNGNDVTRKSAADRSRAGLLLVRSRENAINSLTVAEHLKVARATEAGAALVAHLGMGRRVADLSGGQKQLLALACSLTSRPALIRMYDEPFSELDSVVVNMARQVVGAQGASASLVCLPSISKA